MSTFLRWFSTAVPYIVTLVGAVAVTSVLLAAWRMQTRSGHGAVGRTLADASLMVALGAIVILSFNDPLGNQPDRVNLLPFRDQWWALQGEIDPELATATLIANVALFVPLGAAAAARFPGLSSGRLLLGAIGISLAVEVAQAVLDAGRLADVTDLVANTAGAAMGIAGWRSIGANKITQRRA